MNEVMIDTCAWIDFLRKKEGVLGDAVVKLIEFDKAVICDVVVAELLQGAKGKNEKQQLQLLFNTVQRVTVVAEDWDEAGQLLQDLRRKGITLPLTDALIGAVAVRKQLPVLTADKHFDYLPVNSVSC
jgi:predicted nucleic acid-binding protein